MNSPVFGRPCPKPVPSGRIQGWYGCRSVCYSVGSNFDLSFTLVIAMLICYTISDCVIIESNDITILCTVTPSSSSSTLVQIKAWNLFGKSLSKPMILHRQIIYEEQTSMEILFEIQKYSLKTMPLNKSSTNWWSSCINLDPLLQSVAILSVSTHMIHVSPVPGFWMSLWLRCLCRWESHFGVNLPAYY